MKKGYFLMPGMLSVLLTSIHPVMAAETTAPTASPVKTQIEQLREQSKTGRLEDRAKIRTDAQAIQDLRKSYQEKISALRQQREAALKSKNKDQVKALQQQIQDLKKEKKAKLKDARRQFHQDRQELKKDRKEFRHQAGAVRKEAKQKK